MSRRRRANTQGQSLMAAWQAIPWKKVHRHVFRLQKRIYQATLRGDRDHPDDAGVDVTLHGHDHTKPTTLGPQSLANIDAAIDQVEKEAADGEIVGVGVTGKPFIFAVGADPAARRTVRHRLNADRTYTIVDTVESAVHDPDLRAVLVRSRLEGEADDDPDPAVSYAGVTVSDHMPIGVVVALFGTLVATTVFAARTVLRSEPWAADA